ncbi:MAG TPA: redoxin domain-containing (seleno)protein, partial [Dehalococcoidia bacterium]|nr:redoxin domain-containing (seleno)protein [Dehalococcoidia bacterium]
MMVITVAMDTAGAQAARPWIEAAQPTHPSLIDECHTVSTLYNMVNVPSAVWIDEQGRIVRPTEPAGTSEAWRIMDRTTFTMPPETLSTIGARRRAYSDAIRDWVKNGEESVHALSPDEVRARSQTISADQSLANANFRMGIYLHGMGKSDAAQAYFEEA